MGRRTHEEASKEAERLIERYGGDVAKAQKAPAQQWDQLVSLCLASENELASRYARGLVAATTSKKEWDDGVKASRSRRGHR